MKNASLTIFHPQTQSRLSKTNRDVCRQCGTKLKIGEQVYRKPRGKNGKNTSHYCKNCAILLHLID